MSISRTYYCDEPDCDWHVGTSSTRPDTYMLTVTETGIATLHFCSWDCVLRFAAAKPPMVTIYMDSELDGEAPQ